MAQKIWTADELAKLSPAEQEKIFADGIVRLMVPMGCVSTSNLAPRRTLGY